MNISDIIKKDSDRVFIIAPECYIIFTGDSIEDEFPFLRIGNSLDLPVEIIPLVKNIVIADLPVGNPLIEQCNIDLNTIKHNCYIGTNPFVKHFVNTQNLFELDLNDATIIDAETDRPQELEKNDASAIIGLFYTDGNFKIQKEAVELFSLDEIIYSYFSDYHVQKLLASNKNPGRYAQTGFIHKNNHLLFYKNENFTSIGSSGFHINDFFALQLDPSSIREIIQPYFSYQAIPLLKIQNMVQKGMRIFSDFTLNYEILGAYYKKSIQSIRPFMGMSFSTADGVLIKNISESSNMLITLTQVSPAFEDITFACLMDFAKYDSLLKEPLDCIVIAEEIYATIKPLLQAATLPLFLLCDNPPRKKSPDIVPLFHSVQYDVKKFDQGQQLFEDICKDITAKDLLALCTSELDTNKLSAYIAKIRKDASKTNCIDMLNLQALLRLLLNHTKVKKTAKKARSLLKKLESRYTESSLNSIHGVYYKGTIALLGNFMAIYYQDQQCDHIIIPGSITIKDIRSYAQDSEICIAFNRMLEDRKRLNLLLGLFSKTRKKEVKELKKAVKSRESYMSEQNMRSAKNEIKAQLRKLRLKKFFRFCLVCAVIAAAFFAGDYGWKYYNKRLELEKARVLQAQREQQKKRIEKLVKDYKISVSGTDILKYTNQVAVRNGFAKITLRDVYNKRNPNWIFPGNMLYLLDGEKIFVKKGDTMWAIAGNKLMKRHIAFYTLIDIMKKKIANKESITKELNQARKVAFSDRHFADLKKMRAGRNIYE